MHQPGSRTSESASDVCFEAEQLLGVEHIPGSKPGCVIVRTDSDCPAISLANLDLI